MTQRPIHLIDQNAATIATLDVQAHDGRFEGTICLDATPIPLRQLFEQFEEIVDGQMFSLLDDIEEKIEAARLRAFFDYGADPYVADLQVFPSTRAVSFTTRGPRINEEEIQHRFAQGGGRTLAEILRDREPRTGGDVPHIGEPAPGS